MNVLYEENGSFKVGTVLTEHDSSLQIEAPHGKRSKVKASNVLLRFDGAGLHDFLEHAEAQAAEIDTDFLWQCCGDAEFGFIDLATEYSGRAPSPLESTAILLKLHSAPIYFHRKGKGRRACRYAQSRARRPGAQAIARRTDRAMGAGAATL